MVVHYNDKVIVINGVVIRLGSTVFLCEKITTLWIKYKVLLDRYKFEKPLC